jgi:hypothetical protein
MAKAGKDCGFTPELASILISGEKIILNSNFHTEIFIDCPVDRAHTSLSQDLDDPVTAVQESATFQCHNVNVN